LFQEGSMISHKPSVGIAAYIVGSYRLEVWPGHTDINVD
jgi:hypothetical protein